MVNLHRLIQRSFLLTIATCIAMTFVAAESTAQSEKRGATSAKRDTGTDRKGNSFTSSSRRGSSARAGSTRSGPVLPSEKKKRKSDANKYKTSKKQDDDEDFEPDFGSRSLGKSCMYGPRGEVIFRPRGARCKGDAPAALDAPTEPIQPAEMRESATSRGSVAKKLRYVQPPKRRPSRPRPVSECVYSSDGRVLHTPAGGFCRPGGPEK